jgi:CRP-like cAMP-binding protein
MPESPTNPPSPASPPRSLDPAHVQRDANSPPSGNRLLDTMDSARLRDLLSHSTIVALDLAQVVHEPNELFKYIYFPTDGVVSVLCVMEDGQQAEVSAIGREGMIGSALTLGVDRTPARAIVQIQGAAIRMEAADFAKSVAHDPVMSALLGRYIQSLVVHSSQTIACNELHTIQQRFARWLLQVSDCMNSPEFTLTQEFMSQMLMVRRASVSVVAYRMKKSGLITYRRGKIRVLDRAALEAASCECYQAVEQEYNRLIA